MARDFFGEDPLGIELGQPMASALWHGEGVTSVRAHDSESWFVTGTPSGEALTQAAANVADGLADQLRAGMDRSREGIEPA